MIPKRLKNTALGNNPLPRNKENIWYYETKSKVMLHWIWMFQFSQILSNYERQLPQLKQRYGSDLNLPVRNLLLIVEIEAVSNVNYPNSSHYSSFYGE